MNFLEIAQNRQSCRSYDPERPMEPEKLSSVLESARLGWFDDAKLRPITGLDTPARLVIALGYAAPEEKFRAKARKDLDQLADWKE